MTKDPEASAETPALSPLDQISLHLEIAHLSLSEVRKLLPTLTIDNPKPLLDKADQVHAELFHALLELRERTNEAFFTSSRHPAALMLPRRVSVPHRTIRTGVGASASPPTAPDRSELLNLLFADPSPHKDPSP